MDKVFQVDELTTHIKEKFTFLKELQAIQLYEDDPSGLKSIITYLQVVIASEKRKMEETLVPVLLLQL